MLYWGGKHLVERGNCSATAKKGQRVYLIDEIRGFAILCMVIYHGVYDLLAIFGISFPFFFSPLMNGVGPFRRYLYLYFRHSLSVFP